MKISTPRLQWFERLLKWTSGSFFIRFESLFILIKIQKYKKIYILKKYTNIKKTEICKSPSSGWPKCRSKGGQPPPNHQPHGAPPSDATSPRIARHRHGRKGPVEGKHEQQATLLATSKPPTTRPPGRPPPNCRPNSTSRWHHACTTANQMDVDRQFSYQVANSQWSYLVCIEFNAFAWY